MEKNCDFRYFFAPLGYLCWLLFKKGSILVKNFPHKKILSFFLLLISFFTASSGYVLAENSVVYVGGKIGGVSLDSKVTSDNTFVGKKSIAMGKDNINNLSGRGFEAGLLVGVGRLSEKNDSIYLGGEFSISLSNASGNQLYSIASASGASKLSFKKQCDFEALFKLGYLITEKTRPYLILGVCFTFFELESSFHNTSNGKISTSTTRTFHPGLVLGLGVDISITSSFDVGLRVVHKRFAPVTYEHFLGGNRRVSYKVTPHSSEAHLIFAWKFHQGEPF